MLEATTLTQSPNKTTVAWINTASEELELAFTDEIKKVNIQRRKGKPEVRGSTTALIKEKEHLLKEIYNPR